MISVEWHEFIYLYLLKETHFKKLCTLRSFHQLRTTSAQPNTFQSNIYTMTTFLTLWHYNSTLNQWIDLYYPRWHPQKTQMEGLHVRSSWRFTERHLCGLSSGVRLSFLLPAAPEPRLINDAQLSRRIAYWHTSHTHAALISQWKWPG